MSNPRAKPTIPARPLHTHLRQYSSPNLPADPPQPPPASQQTQTASRLSLSYFPPQPTSAASSRRSVLASKALNLSSRLLTKSASYLSSKDSDLEKPTPSSSSSIRNRRSVQTWDQWDNDTSNWHMQVGGNRLPDPSQPQPQPSNALPTTSSSTSYASGYLSYFNRQNRDKRNRESYTEEHLVCFPGVSTPEKSAA